MESVLKMHSVARLVARLVARAVSKCPSHPLQVQLAAALTLKSPKTIRGRRVNSSREVNPKLEDLKWIKMEEKCNTTTINIINKLVNKIISRFHVEDLKLTSTGSTINLLV